MRRVGTFGLAVAAMTLIGACSSSSDSGSSGSEPSASQPATSVSDVQPGGPAYAFARTDDGMMMRFDPCAGRIRILLNPGDLQQEADPYTDVDVVAQMGELLTQYAQELTELTGMQIEYAGTTDIPLNVELEDRQVIILNFGSTGFPGAEDSYADRLNIYGAEKDGWKQIVSHQYFESSKGFYIHYEEAAKLANGDENVGIDEAGKRGLKTILGEALGLRQLTEDDMLAAGIPIEKHGAEIMYTDSHQEQNGVYNLTWGEGDKAGFAAIGVDKGCF